MEPASGRLTGDDSGPGRRPEVEQILEFVLGHGPLSGKTVLVTAGGTRESIDEVRFIGNSSSGRMGRITMLVPSGSCQRACHICSMAASI